MTAILLVIVTFILLYMAYQGKVGFFACFSLLFFSIAVSLFYVTSSALFSLNAVFHTALFAILLIWQFNYYTWRNVFDYVKNPAVLSVLAISVIMVLYNDISPYYHTYKDVINSAQFGFYSRVLFPFLLLPLMVPDRYTRHEMIHAIPFWGIIYLIVFLLSFDISSLVFSDRTQLRENTDGITGSITLSRILAIIIIASFIRLIATERSQKSQQTIYALLCLLFCLLLLIAGQRGTLIGLGIALAVLMIRREWRHHSLTIIALAIVGVLIAITFIDFSQFEIFRRFSELQNYESFQRYHDYGRVWDIFKNNDFLWGLGSKGYFFKTGRVHPHNIILEHISDYGIWGLICVIVLLFCCIKYAVILIRHSNSSVAISIACCWMTLCFSNMVSSLIFTNGLFYLFSGLLVMEYQEYIKEERNNNLSELS
jgi:O-Antigen ligase.